MSPSEKSSDRPGVSRLLEVVRRSVGVYGVAPTCHLSALARMDGYRLAHLDQALGADRSLYPSGNGSQAASVERIQAEYISALRSGDATRAADVRNRLGGAISGLREELHAPIGEVKTWAVSRLDQVAAIVTQL